MSVTNDTLAAVRKPKIGIQSEECVEFDFNGLRDQPPRARAQDFRKRIVDFIFLSKMNNSILVHGVTLSLGGSGGFGYQPRYAAFFTPSPRFRYSSETNAVT
jgi:hypothetical protein